MTQKDLPDDIKATEDIPLDIPAALDAITFQFRLANEGIDRLIEELRRRNSGVAPMEDES